MDEIKDIDTKEIKNPKAVIEAIMFAAGYPMKYEKLAETLGLTPSEIKRYVSELSEKYNSDDFGIMILMFPETCQFCTKEAHLPLIKEALGIKRGGNLSNSSMEVLAIVAYNQPVTRSFVDLVRGVDSNYAMSSLIDKGLIESCGRLDAPGRPMLYGTTDKFLRVFGLTSVNELPEIELLRASEEQMEIMAPGEEITEEE
ncbi:MAG: SMC-Scp complex subunit ScpB [Clostridia bacterium]|nr:SMC-Scp complex subunit ScpB [Clostridia bacterium]